MSFWMVLGVAFDALACNKVRSFLTALGIIIGVGAVIAMVSLGQGAQARVEQEIASMGTNILMIRPGSLRSWGVHGGGGTQQSLSAADFEAIAAECPAVALASPTIGAGAQIVFGNQNWNTRVEGYNQHFLAIRNWRLEQGEFFTEAHVKSAARVAVLGKTVAERLFPSGDAVGQTIRIRNLPFKVLGVLAPKGENAWGRDQDDTVIVPYTAVQKKLLGGATHVQGGVAAAVSPRATHLAQQQIEALLRQRHRIGPGQEDDFTVRNQTDIAEAAEATNRVLTLLLGSIAAVSLLVGGIGIMNIMLVAVSERTREIGIRMAVGARPRHIRLQFLAESMVLCLVGGMLGIGAGIAGSYGISGLLGWPTLISPASVLISVTFAAAVGIFFGLYPAHKAASLDPIEALRYE